MNLSQPLVTPCGKARIGPELDAESFQRLSCVGRDGAESGATGNSSSPATSPASLTGAGEVGSGIVGFQPVLVSSAGCRSSESVSEVFAGQSHRMPLASTA